MSKQAVPDRMCTRKDLEEAFVELGVKPGMILSVHSALSSLGFVPGGARSVVDALLSVLGPEGTLVMPAHCGDSGDPAYWREPPVPQAWWPTIRETTPPFDKARSPSSHMGAVAECFRAYPGVFRSDHPLNSFIAFGPAAQDILARHDLDCSLGEHSPCGALDRMDAWILLIGVSYERCTEMHLAEYRSRCRTFFRQGASVLQEGRPAFVYYPEMELDSDDFLEPGRLLEVAGLVRKTRIGGSDLRLFKVRDAVGAATDWLLHNRLHRQGEEDRKKILDYLKDEPEYNLFIIGDIENFGMATDFQDVMAYEKDGRLDSVLLRYHRSYIPYSRYDDFELKPILSALDTPNLKFLSGKKSIMEKLRPHYPDFTWRRSFLMRLGRADLGEACENRQEPPGVLMRSASIDDIPPLVDFLMSIEEFANLGTRDERIRQMTKAISSGSGRYYLYWKSGRIVASAGTTAENSVSAMVIGVATAVDCRNQGLASRLVSALGKDLLSGHLQYLCLFYDNPDAGSIYRRLGFKDAGEWILAIPPDPVSGSQPI